MERVEVAGDSGDDDFPIGLKGDAVAHVSTAAKVSYQYPIAVERSVEGAVRIIADEREVSRGAIGAGTISGDNNLSVQLESDGIRLVDAIAVQMSRDHACPVERSIQRAVWIKAREQEGGLGIWIGISGNNDFPIRLNGNGTRRAAKAANVP